jgi:hypothetical protein
MKKLKCSPFIVALVILVVGLIVSCMMKRREGVQGEYVPPVYGLVSSNSNGGDGTLTGNVLENTPSNQNDILNSVPISNYTRSPEWDGTTKMSPSRQVTFSSWINNMDMNGNEYPNGPTNATMQECQLKCKNDNMCAAFVTDFQGSGKRGNCWLKTKGGSKMPKEGRYLKVKT